MGARREVLKTISGVDERTPSEKGKREVIKTASSSLLGGGENRQGAP